MDRQLWPSGLRVLVIDNNSSYLSIMEELLIKCSYNVTTYNDVWEAMSFIYGNIQNVDLIISDVFFPSEDSLLILREVTSKFDIPTVIMSSNGDTSIVMKYITNGASDFLIKPVRIEELKNVWQHVFRKQIGEKRSSCNNAHQHHLDQVSAYPPPTCIAASTCAPRTTTTGIVTEATATLQSATRETTSNGTVTDIQDLRKSRLSWTTQLHRQFIAAVNSLGEKAVPKKILETMKVKHLTREQVASHLQKYRLHLRKLNQTSHKDDTPSSSSRPNESNILRTEFDSSLNSTYFDQDGCLEITEYSLPKDDLSSASDFMLGERSNYSPQGFQDFKWNSEKQGSETTCLWNFKADE